MAVRARGREALAATTDPNNSHMTYSGLAIGRLNPGQAVTCTFTVEHHYVFDPWGGPTETFGGVVLDPNGLVILELLPQDTVTLTWGKYLSLSLFSQGVVPTSLAGQAITVVVGPAIMFTGVLVGQPLGLSGGVLTATAQVPAVASGPPTLIHPSAGLWRDLALFGGGAVLLGGTAYAIRERRKRMVDQ